MYIKNPHARFLAASLRAAADHLETLEDWEAWQPSLTVLRADLYHAVFNAKNASPEESRKGVEEYHHRLAGDPNYHGDTYKNRKLVNVAKPEDNA